MITDWTSSYNQRAEGETSVLWASQMRYVTSVKKHVAVTRELAANDSPARIWWSMKDVAVSNLNSKLTFSPKDERQSSLSAVLGRKSAPTSPVLLLTVYTARGLVGTADGLPGVINLAEFLCSRGPGVVGIRSSVCRGLVRGGSRDTKCAALGRENVSHVVIIRTP